jgi:hypothetical protein
MQGSSSTCRSSPKHCGPSQLVLFICPQHRLVPSGRSQGLARTRPVQSTAPHGVDKCALPHQRRLTYSHRYRNRLRQFLKRQTQSHILYCMCRNVRGGQPTEIGSSTRQSLLFFFFIWRQSMCMRKTTIESPKGEDSGYYSVDNLNSNIIGHFTQ